MEYLSKERHDEIAAELRHLIEDVYPKVSGPLRNAAPQNREHYAGLRILETFA